MKYEKIIINNKIHPCKYNIKIKILTHLKKDKIFILI